MTARAALAWLALLGTTSFAACDGSEIAVFSEAGAGAMHSGDDVVAGAGGSLVGASGAAPMNTAQAGTDDVAGASSTDAACQHPEECPAGRFCAKSACQDMLGICEPQPLFCDAVAAPVCGCNHVTYWNDCLRRQHGVAASSPGECGAGAKACTSDAECDRGTCAHLLLPPSTCDAPSGPGTCWVTPPPDCGATTDHRGWLECPPPQMAAGGSGGVAPCASTCEALRDGHPFTPLDGGAACP